MLSLNKTKSPDSAWKRGLLSIIPGCTDQGNDAGVLKAFEDGVAWAQKRGVPHKHNAKHYAEKYLRAGIIPTFMRAYCAFMLDIVPHEGIVWSSVDLEPKPVPQRKRRRHEQDEAPASMAA